MQRHEYLATVKKTNTRAKEQMAETMTSARANPPVNGCTAHPHIIAALSASHAANCAMLDNQELHAQYVTNGGDPAEGVPGNIHTEPSKSIRIGSKLLGHIELSGYRAHDAIRLLLILLNFVVIGTVVYMLHRSHLPDTRTVMDIQTSLAHEVLDP